MSLEDSTAVFESSVFSAVKMLHSVALRMGEGTLSQTFEIIVVEFGVVARFASSELPHLFPSEL